MLCPVQVTRRPSQTAPDANRWGLEQFSRTCWDGRQNRTQPAPCTAPVVGIFRCYSRCYGLGRPPRLRATNGRRYLPNVTPAAARVPSYGWLLPLQFLQILAELMPNRA